MDARKLFIIFKSKQWKSFGTFKLRSLLLSNSIDKSNNKWADPCICPIVFLASSLNKKFTQHKNKNLFPQLLFERGGKWRKI